MSSYRIDVDINSKNTGSGYQKAGKEIDQLKNSTNRARDEMGRFNRETQKSEQATSKHAQSMNKLKGGLSQVGGAANSLGGALSGLIGIGIGAWLLQCVNVAKQSEDAWKKLDAVVTQYGGNVDNTRESIEKLSEKNGFLVSDTREAARVFIQAGNSIDDVTKANGDLTAAMGLSVATGKTVTDSAVQMERAYMGNGRALKLLGIDIKDYKDNNGVVDREKLNQAILEKTSSQLEAHGKSYEAMQIKFDIAYKKFQKSIGMALLPVLSTGLDWATKLLDGFNNLNKPMKDFIVDIGLAVGGVTALGLVLGPVITTLSTMGKIAGGIKTVASAMWDLADATAASNGYSLPGRGGKAGKTVAMPKGTTMPGGSGVINVAEGGIGAKLASMGTLVGGTVVAGAVTAGTMIGDLGYHIAKGQGFNSVYNSMSDLGSVVRPLFGQSPISGAAYKDATQPAIDSFTKSDPFALSKLNIKMPTTADILKAMNLDHPIKWPDVGAIGKSIEDKIPKLNWKWPDIGAFGNWIQSKIPHLGWKIPSWNDIASYIQNKISWLHFPSISWDSIAGWIRGNIDSLHFPYISWDSVAGWIRNAIGSFHWPSGPAGVVGGWVNSAVNAYQSAKSAAQHVASSATSAVSNAGSYIQGAAQNTYNWAANGVNWLLGRGPGDIHYENYAGMRHSPFMADGSMSGNCMDLTAGLIQAAGRGTMEWTTWNGGPHVYAKIDGKKYDPARKALENTWSPPARGPGNHSSGSTIINLNGDCYGYDDFVKQVEKANGTVIGRAY